MAIKQRHRPLTQDEVENMRATVAAADAIVSGNTRRSKILSDKVVSARKIFSIVSEDTEIIEYLANYKRALVVDLKASLNGQVSTTSRSLRRPTLWRIFADSFGHMQTIGWALGVLPSVEEEIVRLMQKDEQHFPGDITRALADDFSAKASDKHYKAADGRKKRILRLFEWKRDAGILSLHHLVKGCLNAACDQPDAPLDHVVPWIHQLRSLIVNEQDQLVLDDALTVDWPNKQSEIDARLAQEFVLQPSS